MSKPEMKDEIDFRDLLREPEKLFGYGYLYFLAIILVLGMLYVLNLTVIGKNAVPPAVLRDSTVLVQDIPFQSPTVLPPVDVLQVGVASDSLVTRGRELFRANCSSCHGENGMGDGPSGAGMNPKPRNFSSLQGWANGSKVSQIYRTLQEGIVKNGMASYSYLPPGDRFALAHYVRTFTPGQPVDTPDELRQLDALYQLSRGASTPGQIPIRNAMRRVLAESEAQVRTVSRLVHEMESESNDPGADTLLANAENLTQVVLTLIVGGPELPSKEDLVCMAAGDPRGMGFKARVARLSDAGWTVMYDYLKRLEADKGG